jgi:A/G-specific adenine glycosylase
MKNLIDPESEFRHRLTAEGISPSAVRLFRKIIYRHYRENFRKMPWRRTKDPYRVLLSEIMLQQTQVDRVLLKYAQFIRSFPDFPSLATARLSHVLRVWQGMGYNRRALSLKRLAEIVMKQHEGRLPTDPEDLVRLPGIGPYSASAIYTFIHNKPSLFIETNIRRVYIHFFFSDREEVKDSEIMPVLEKTLDNKEPRDWYYALMDYGAKLKKEVKNPNRRSAHYRPQPAFAGSRRQVRGMMLRAILQTPGMTKDSLRKTLCTAPEDFSQILDELRREGLIQYRRGRFNIP